MGFFYTFRYSKFQQGRLDLELTRIKDYLRNQSLGVTREKYLEICEATGSEVDISRIPIDFGDLSSHTRLSMEIVNLLTDKWDATAGSYLGKDLGLLPFLLDLYEVTDKVLMVQLIMEVIAEGITITNDKLKAKPKHGKK